MDSLPVELRQALVFLKLLSHSLKAISTCRPGSCIMQLHSVAQDEYSTYWEPEKGIPLSPF